MWVVLTVTAVFLHCGSSSLVQADSGKDCYERDIDYKGADIGGRINVASAKHCQELCAKKIGCKYFTYVTSNHKWTDLHQFCLFKSGNEGARQAEGMISGPVKCQGGDEGGSTGGGSGGNDDSIGGDPIESGVCGDAAVSASSYIVGGKETTPHSLPWTVGLQKRHGSQYYNFCGGSILSEHYVLTAAHCVKPGDEIYIVAGAHSKKNWENEGGKRYKVEKIINHSQYNIPNRQAEHDISLLKIAGGIKLTTHAMPVCLPPATQKWTPGTDFVVSGWGGLNEGAGGPDKLHQVTVPFVDSDKCAKMYAKIAFDRPASYWDTAVCAGREEGGKDSCQGDSGGPMVAKLDGKWTQAGVVSWGYGCARAGYPGVYTDVAYHMDWIKENMN